MNAQPNKFPAENGPPIPRTLTTSGIIGIAEIKSKPGPDWSVLAIAITGEVNRKRHLAQFFRGETDVVGRPQYRREFLRPQVGPPAGGRGEGGGIRSTDHLSNKVVFSREFRNERTPSRGIRKKTCNSGQSELIWIFVKSWRDRMLW